MIFSILIDFSHIFFYHHIFQNFVMLFHLIFFNFFFLLLHFCVAPFHFFPIFIRFLSIFFSYSTFFSFISSSIRFYFNFSLPLFLILHWHSHHNRLFLLFYVITSFLLFSILVFFASSSIGEEHSSLLSLKYTVRLGFSLVCIHYSLRIQRFVRS